MSAAYAFCLGAVFGTLLTAGATLLLCWWFERRVVARDGGEG